MYGGSVKAPMDKCFLSDNDEVILHSPCQIFPNYAPVSVIVPLHNFHDCLDCSINALAQSVLPPAEVIVVDDGSTDAVASWYVERLRELGAHFQIHLHRIEGCGVGYARNYGLLKATQPWIAFLDSDDRWPADYLQSRVDALGSGCDVLCGPFHYVNQAGDVLEIVRQGTQKWLKVRLAWSNPIANSSVVCSRHFLLTHGGYSMLRARSDYATWLRLCWSARASFVIDRDGPRPLIMRRRYSLSANKFRMAVYNYLAFREAGLPQFLAFAALALNVIDFLLRALKLRVFRPAFRFIGLWHRCSPGSQSG